MTTPESPTDLAPPLTAPEPVPGCDVCEALARQRVEAQLLGEYSRVSDCNMEIRSHPHAAADRP